MKRAKWIFLWLCVGLYGIILTFLFSCTTQNRMPVSPGAQLISEADYVGREGCAACHEEIVADFDSTLHNRMQISGPEGQQLDLTCEACHGPGSLHVEVRGGRDTPIILPEENPEACYQCHRDVQARFFQEYRHPVPLGKMSCMDCHDPHGKDIYSPVGVKMFNREDVCYQCHQEQTGPYVFEHEALREGCTSCHNPHGSINEKYLVQRDSNLCLRCHGQIAVSGTVVMGDFSHTTRVAEGTCWSAGCHTAVHGSNINDHLRY